MNDVDKMIAGLTNEDFIGEYWMQKPCHMHAGQFFLEQSKLLPPEKLLWHDTILRPEKLEVVLKGLIYDIPRQPDFMATPEAIAEVARSFVVTAHDLCENNIFYRELSHQLTECFMANYHQVGAFIALRRAAGLNKHKDLLHVFAFQHIGISRWFIYDRTGKNLLRVATLEPGDILYVPAGFYHHVSRLTKRTYHVSMAFRYSSPDDAAQALCWSPELRAVLTAEQQYLYENYFISTAALKQILKKKFNIVQTHTRTIDP